MLRIAALAFPNADPRALREELLATMLEECDYRLEAVRQTRFREIWAEHPVITVPEVLPELSADGVLTSAFVDGERFEDFKSRPDADRSRAATAMMEFMLVSLLAPRAGSTVTPTRGNYLFTRDGRVAFSTSAASSRSGPTSGRASGTSCARCWTATRLP